MGCISSKKEIDDIYPNVFQVMNVDEHGNPINSGQLEITDMDLVLYQHAKPPIKWPLRTLRRYGFDSEHFSFESGRRCQTGPGIYAFRCRRAEQLFNLLQSRIQIRNNGELGDGTENTGTSRESGYMEPTSVRRSNPGIRFTSQNEMPRLSSTASTSGTFGPMSPQSAISQSFLMDNPPLLGPRSSNQNLYANEEIIACLMQDVEETNNNKMLDESLSSPLGRPYANTALVNVFTREENGDISQSESPTTTERNHLYMNVIPGIGNSIPSSVASKVPTVIPDKEPNDRIHNYANFDIENNVICPKTPPPTNFAETKNLNYIVLDLEPCSDSTKAVNVTLPPESPRKLTGGYAAIDFKKTVALSHSVNPNFDNDSEGSRKTRHNSNINDLIGHIRHSPSVSD